MTHPGNYRPTILHFEDRGQDFLWWEIDDAGLVVDCGPSQAWAWIGSRVDITRIYDDRVVHFKTKDGFETTLNYLMVDITHDMYEIFEDDHEKPNWRGPDRKMADLLLGHYAKERPNARLALWKNGVVVHGDS